MKKLAAIVTVLCLILTGCGNSGGQPSSSEASSAPESAAVSSAPPESSSEPSSEAPKTPVLPMTADSLFQYLDGFSDAFSGGKLSTWDTAESTDLDGNPMQIYDYKKAFQLALAREEQSGKLVQVMMIANLDDLTDGEADFVTALQAEVIDQFEPGKASEIIDQLAVNEYAFGDQAAFSLGFQNGAMYISVVPPESFGSGSSSDGAESPAKKEFSMMVSSMVSELDAVTEEYGDGKMSAWQTSSETDEDGSLVHTYKHSDGLSVLLRENPSSGNLFSLFVGVSTDKASDGELKLLAALRSSVIAGFEPDRKYEIDEKLGDVLGEQDVKVALGDNASFTYIIDDVSIIFMVSPA
ncbi:hypothetical protein [Clostridium sp. D33t1_170424_F3]|uniref:hypothetical protein n=1 Tax=Clostridium sp. D33t1_170424_F3 TaxID=2787099 RepID=UPI0018AC5E45|nr:hypothetical protein [Clostridium sp. D33t1_170424_F3]